MRGCISLQTSLGSADLVPQAASPVAPRYRRSDADRGRFVDAPPCVRRRPGAARVLERGVHRSGTAGTRQEWPIVGSWASGKVRQLSVPGKKIESKRAAPDIPPKADRRWKNCFSPWLYRRRNAIQRMFGRLKDFRRIATRYDRLASNFLAAVCLAATCYWL